MNDEHAQKIPVTIITGFLGSGKTTLLNHAVKQPGMKSTAVIINEFGEVGIDHLLVETSTELMVEMNNGCICCTIRGDLADKLGSLAMWIDAGRIPRVERVVVETTGLADPAPILHTLMTDQHLLDRFRLGGVLTVVDAVTGPSSLDRFPEATKQVALADIIILSKLDLVDTLSDRASYAGIKARIHAINARAEIHEVTKGMMDPEILCGIGDKDVEATFAEFSDWLGAASGCGGVGECHLQSCGHSHEHRHEKRNDGITTFVIKLKEAVNCGSFNDFLQQLATEFGENLLRVKGILHVGDTPDRPAVIQGVQHVFFPISWLDHWPDEERVSKLVFITQGLAPKVIEDRFSERFS